MNKHLFMKIPISEFPSNYIPAGADEFVSWDAGNQDESVVVKGFILDGVIHIQEVEDDNR